MILNWRIVFEAEGDCEELEIDSLLLFSGHLMHNNFLSFRVDLWCPVSTIAISISLLLSLQN